MRIYKEYTEMSILEAIIYGFIFLFIISWCCGCYSTKKAQKDFGRVAATYPEIPADYCARVYPPQNFTIHGKDSIRVDTFWSSETVIRDSIIHDRDTVRIFYTKQIPGTVITRTVNRTDTVYAENRAALDKCEIEKSRAMSNEQAVRLERDKQIELKKIWRKSAIYTWILLVVGLGAGILLNKYKVI